MTDTNQHLKLSVADALQAVGFAGLCAYGVGWLFAVFTFHGLGLQPEDVGIDAQFLLVRATVVASAVSLIPVVWSAAFAKDLVGRARLGIPDRFAATIITVIVAFFVLSTASLAAVLRYSYPTGRRLLYFLLAATVGVILTIIETICLLKAFDFEVPATGPRLGMHLDLRWLLSATAIFVIVLGVSAIVGGSAVRRQLEAGRSVKIPGFTIVFVRIPLVSPVDTGEGPVSEICGLRLGVRDETMVVLEASRHVVLEIPKNNMTAAVATGSC